MHFRFQTTLQVGHYSETVEVHNGVRRIEARIPVTAADSGFRNGQHERIGQLRATHRRAIKAVEISRVVQSDIAAVPAQLFVNCAAIDAFEDFVTLTASTPFAIREVESESGKLIVATAAFGIRQEHRIAIRGRRRETADPAAADLVRVFTDHPTCPLVEIPVFLLK